jgi:hypothetical protein
MTIGKGSRAARAALVAAALALAGAGGVVVAQNASEKVVKIPDNVLSVSEIESRLSAQGIRVKEIEVRDLIAEVEGYDAQGREIEIVVDRRNGEILAHKFDR